MALSPVPFRIALADVRTMLLRQDWVLWLISLKDAIDAAAQKRGGVSLTAQSAVIVATAVPTPVLTAGLYRVSYYARITRAGTVSSSFTLTVRWTDGGVACSQTFAALTGNTTATAQTSSVLVRADEGTTIRYDVAYATSGATTMLFALDVRVESQP